MIFWDNFLNFFINIHVVGTHYPTTCVFMEKLDFSQNYYQIVHFNMPPGIQKNRVLNCLHENIHVYCGHI